MDIQYVTACGLVHRYQCFEDIYFRDSAVGIATGYGLDARGTEYVFLCVCGGGEGADLEI
jgi:hypothetical protein